jgi:ribosome-associated protein
MKTEALEITPGLKLQGSEFQMEYIRASGPGGQNVNKVASAAQLRFDVRNSSLPEEIKARLIKLAGKRITQAGVLIIEARRYRTQEQNREDALARLAALIEKASKRPRARRQTKPTRAAREKRLESKKRKGEIKSLRRNRSFDS